MRTSPIVERVLIRTETLQRSDPTWRTSSYAASSVDIVHLGLECEGLVGRGASAAHPVVLPSPDLVAQIQHVLVPALEGAPLRDVPQRLAQLTGAHPRVRLAADLALHDLLGRRADVPAEVMWGGAVRDRIRVVRLVGLKPPDELVASIRTLYEEGCRGFKIKIGQGVDRDVDRVRRVREAFPDVLLMADANGHYDLDGAVRLSAALADLDLYCLEQPLPYEDLGAMVQLRSRSLVPILADQLIGSVDDAARILAQRPADLVSIKLGSLGSVQGALRLAHICLAHGARPHVGAAGGSGLVDSALTRLASVLPGGADIGEVGESRALLQSPSGGFEMRDGWAASDGSAGLGGHADGSW